MKWFRRRSYKHVDHPVGVDFATKVMQPNFVKAHAFSPLIHYDKDKIKYKPEDHKTNTKPRPIHVPSHRDSCIYSYYAHQLSERLEALYETERLDDKAIAYRKLGLGNYDFSADVLDFARQNAPCTIVCIDVKGFFENLDHKLLKRRVADVLGVKTLPEDWYAVFRSVTAYHFLELEHVKAIPEYAKRLRLGGAHPIATVAELKSRGVEFSPNTTAGRGIPQGTPISAVLANVYMIEFDKIMRDLAERTGGLYRRYSDDILFVCNPEAAVAVQEVINGAIKSIKLDISPDKTEVTPFDPSKPIDDSHRCAQYLGYTFYPGGAGIRPGSMARHWRKMKQAVKHLERRARYTAADKPIYTKKVRKRFSPVNARNFSRYARISATTFGRDSKIKHQIKRAEKWMDGRLREIKATRAAAAPQVIDDKKSVD